MKAESHRCAVVDRLVEFGLSQVPFGRFERPFAYARAGARPGACLRGADAQIYGTVSRDRPKNEGSCPDLGRNLVIRQTVSITAHMPSLV